MLVYLLTYIISTSVVAVAVYRWGLKQGYNNAHTDIVSNQIYQPAKKKKQCAGKACSKPECTNGIDDQRACSNKTKRIVLKG